MRNSGFQKKLRWSLPLSLIFVLQINVALAQLTINVTSIPPTTPPDAEIYIAGNFNSWNPGNASYILTDHQNGTYSITFTPPVGTLEYKFTRGSWETGEGSSSGNYIPNRTYNYTGCIKSTNVTIAGWEGKGTHTYTDNVQILDDDFYMPQLDRHRRIWLYLPPNYQTSTKRYPVFYMQDGQNLFDVITSFAGEWKVDESMNELFGQSDYGAIIVGIDNGGANRTNEYSPWRNPNYGGGQGEAYASFLVNTLKPHIDSMFRTRTEREYTGIGGSSLGANISMFTAVEHQDVFSKVGIFSPAFWFSDSIYQHITTTGIDEELRIYFVAGTNESSTIISDMQAVYDTLVYAGLEESNMKLLSHTDGAHSEWYWAREYPAAYDWLYGELVLNTSTTKEKKGLVFPNPVTQFLWIRSDEPNMHVTIYSITGNVIASENLLQNRIDVSNLPQGIYFIEVKSLSDPGYFISRFIKL